MINLQMLSLIIVLAQSQNTDGNVIQSLETCASINNSDEAVICFQTETSKLKARIESGEVIVLDRATATLRNQEAFGRREIVRANELVGAEAPDRIETTLVSSAQRPDGKILFTLGDGSLWVQTDSDPIRFGLRNGSTAVVKRASMGSFMLRIGTGRDIRVSRLD